MGKADVLEQAWPATGLERLGACPLCDSAGRTVLHEGLQDRIFFAAPGEWTMWQCHSCRCGYLDPRPTEATIAAAHSSYYTHQDDASDPAPASLTERLRLAVTNDYRNARFGTRARPSLSGGRLLGLLSPPQRRRWDLGFRFLPRADKGGSAVLDVGSGGGGFLKLAAELGWQVGGVEPDKKSRALCPQYDVRPALSDWLPGERQFDHATLSHVIEHVHDVRGTLSQLAELMRPGATIYIETPNLAAPTHGEFGACWRGLEPPRHLVMLNRSNLQALLQQAGFDRVRFFERKGAREFLQQQSRAIRAGLDPYGGDRIGPPPRCEPLSGLGHGDEPEFLTATATLR